MFGSRLPADVAPNALARKIAAARASGQSLLDLTESNPTRAGIVYPEQEILRGFADRRALVYDPECLGLPAAREQIAKLAGVSVARLLLTASTSEAYSWLFKLLCDPGDEVLVPRPSYPLFEHLAALEAVRVRHYPLRYAGGWFIDLPAVAERIGPRTRAVVVVNPNNPTGSYLKRNELCALEELCSTKDLAIISDEVFGDYALEEDGERAGTVAAAGLALTFALNGLSKLVGLPQMKLGWIAIGGPETRVAAARERLEIIADTYLSVGTPVQVAVPALLGARAGVQKQILERLRENLLWLRGAAATSRATLLRVEGGWYATLRVPETRTEDEWVELLLAEGVLVQPGYFYDFERGAYLVLSLLTPQAEFQQGAARLLRLTSE